MSTLIKSPTLPALRSMMEDLWNSEKLFDKAFFKNDWLPAVNVKETEKNYKIEVAAPGFKKDDFKVNIEHGVLSISAETEEEKDEKEENFTRKEFSKSSFVRSFSLPDNIKENAVEAKYEDGMLKLVLGKTAGKKTLKKEIAIS